MVQAFWYPVLRVERVMRPRIILRGKIKAKYFIVEIYLWLATVILDENIQTIYSKS